MSGPQNDSLTLDGGTGIIPAPTLLASGTQDTSTST
jgi:hypothetical protein